MDGQIPVGIVHASRLIRDGTGELLSRQPGLRVVGAFGNGGDLLQQPFEDEHILLYDLATARQDGAALLKEVHTRLPRAKIVMFNVIDDDQIIIECASVGVSGCILQEASLEELLQAVDSVWRGTPVVSPRCITSLFAYIARLQAGNGPPPSIHLTKREEQILQLLSEGLSNKEIAHQLFLQPQTVKNYVHLLLQKLDLHSRLDVIKLLRSAGR